MERGPCRAARRPSRSPVKGAEAQRTGRGGLRRAPHDVKVRGGKRTRAELRRLQKEFFSRVDHLAAAFQRKRDEALARGARLPPDDPPWTAGA